MATDYRKQREEFQKLSFDERKLIVIGILESFRGKGETFDLVHDYVTRSPDVNDQDLQDVYDSLLKTSFEVDQEKEHSAIGHLETVRQKAVEMRKKEEEEQMESAKEADALLEGF